ncbi:hypothetical protein LCGC14_3149090, partial [marine sediment metagenome]
QFKAVLAKSRFVAFFIFGIVNIFNPYQRDCLFLFVGC